MSRAARLLGAGSLLRRLRGGAAGRDLRADPGRPGDRRLVDDPAAGRRQHPRRLADQARGRPGLASAERGAAAAGCRPASSPTAALILVGGTLMLTPGLRHRRVRDRADPAVHPAGRPAAADPGGRPRRLLGRRRTATDARRPGPGPRDPWSGARSIDDVSADRPSSGRRLALLGVGAVQVRRADLAAAQQLEALLEDVLELLDASGAPAACPSACGPASRPSPRAGCRRC